MGPSIYSKSVLKGLNNQMDMDIRLAAHGDPRLKKEILKVLQRANRRAQNVEKAGLISPALKALEAERGVQGYSKFSITGLNLQNEFDWIKARTEYARALAFLNNPTSSATGARQYLKSVSDRYTDGDLVKARIILEKATSPEVQESGEINIFRYNSILTQYAEDTMEVQREMYENKEQYEQALEQKLNESLGKIVDKKAHDDNLFTALFGDGVTFTE